MKHNKQLVYNNGMLINLEQLHTFALAAEFKNFSLVADKLNISAAAVGKQIKSLEHYFRAQLFYRTTRHMELTEFGSALREQCKTLLNEVNNITGLAADFHGQVYGKLKVFTSFHFGEIYILPFTGEFLKKYPNLELEIELEDRIPDMETENLDLVIGLMGGIPQHYTRRKIKEDKYVICGSKEYFKKNKKPMKPEDLINHKFIIHSNRPSKDIIEFNENLKVRVNPIVSVNNTKAIYQCCLDGVGLAMLHSDIVKSAIKHEKLIEVLPNFSLPYSPLYLYYKTVKYLKPSLRILIDYMIKKIG